MLGGAQAAVIFSENFGTLANGTAITTSNTSLTYARVSSGTGSYLNAVNPSSIGSGAGASLYSTSASLTGLGVTSGLAFGSSGNLGTFAFNLLTPTSYGTGSIFFAVGSGTTFTGNAVFAGADLTAAFQISSGQLQTRNGTASGSWTNIGSSSAFAANTEYDISISFNTTASTVTYGSLNQYSVASFTADIWVNGSLFGDNVAIKSALPPGGTTGFRIYTTSDAASAPYVVDNIIIDNSLVVPEPRAWVMIGIGIWFMLWNVRRKRRLQG